MTQSKVNEKEKVLRSLCWTPWHVTRKSLTTMKKPKYGQLQWNMPQKWRMKKRQTSMTGRLAGKHHHLYCGTRCWQSFDRKNEGHVKGHVTYDTSRP